MREVFCLAAILGILSEASADAQVTISTATTQNVTCTAGKCVPTADTANLNVTDLETLLSAGNVEIETSYHRIQAANIHVNAALTWSSATTLALDALDSVVVMDSVSVPASGGLSLTVDVGNVGMLSFAPGGSISFESLSGSLSINGKSYTLVDNISSLASAIADNPAGFYALAAPYDAANDGVYSSPPIGTTLTGTVEGLGNAISNLSIADSTDANVGLFAQVGAGGTIEDFGLTNAQVESQAQSANVGTLVGDDLGALPGDFADGQVNAGTLATVGGLAGYVEQGGSIIASSSSVAVLDRNNGADLGGLVGYSWGTLEQSFATGAVKGGTQATAGGLTGGNLHGSIKDCYATGSVTGRGPSWIGGIAGYDDSTLSTSYATGRIRDGAGGYAGGVVGFMGEDYGIENSYWDVTTTHIDQGVGDNGSFGVTGLTSKQLRSGVPTGFDTNIWTETRKVNNGFPYLIANPPRG
jgi:hypothetical protein